MLPKEFDMIGDGIIQVSKPEYLKKILVEADIEQHYIVEPKPFARWVKATSALIIENSQNWGFALISSWKGRFEKNVL